jgi:DNA-binding XRE family transcriptional regulator
MNTKLKAKIIERYGKQIEFARAIGVSEQKVTRVVTGRLLPEKEEQAAWAKALDTTVAEVFPG